MTGNEKKLSAETLEGLRSLSDGAGPSLLLELINMYLNSTPDRVAQMKLAHEKNELKRLSEIAHSLKSSSGNLGAMGLHKICQSLEHAGSKQIEGFDFAAEFQKLDQEMAAVCSELLEEKRIEENQKAA